MKRNVYLLFLSCMFVSPVLAQPLLTLNEALKLALQNNYSIQIAQNEAAILKNQNTMGAAGMLPVVNATAQQDNQQLDTRQKFLNGAENNRDGAKNNTLNAGVELGWTIFDGFKMFATKNKLEEIQQVGELRMRLLIEVTLQRVIRAYYDALLAKQQLLANRKAVELSEQRYQLAEMRFQAGKSARMEVLRAQVDLNTDKAALLRQENTLNNTKTALNQLLARELNTAFELPDSVLALKTYNLTDLTNKAGSQNVSLLMAKKNQYINLLQVRELRAERMPVIQLRSGYNFNRLESEVGFLQSSQNNGFHYGAALSVNIFNGFDVTRKLKNAQINLRTSELVYHDSISRVQTAIQQAFNSYTMSAKLVQFEKENLLIAKQNFEITQEQYQVGVITALELRDAQQNLLMSELRLLTAQHESKLNEAELLRLSGEMMQLITP